jgi:hypothetical protein
VTGKLPAKNTLGGTPETSKALDQPVQAVLDKYGVGFTRAESGTLPLSDAQAVKR